MHGRGSHHQDDAHDVTRPRVVCHMMASIDGRIVTDGWPLSPEGRRQYELVHVTYEPQGWLCGRVTMELHFAQRTRSDADVAREYGDAAPRDDYRAPGEHHSFAFIADSRGRLVWDMNDIDGDHIVVLLSERVSDDHLTALRDRGISYMLAGQPQVDLSLALEKIAAQYGVRTLLLEGGGHINGGMLRAGLIDEISVLVAPVVDGRVGTPSVFDIAGEGVVPCRLVLDSVERRADDVLWLRYRVEPS
jgi:2,5-diamino-6-(ribosylamino)-4(3H)-pyrimidinone 5'-phosphate reductase